VAERFVVDVQTIPDMQVVVESFFVARERIEQMQEPITDAAAIGAEAIRQRFEDQDFAPLSANTRKKVGARGEGFILVDTGAMYDAATSLLAWNIEVSGTQAVAQYDPNFIDGAAPYFRFHLTGTAFMPKRDFLALDVSTMESDIDKVFERFVEDALVSAGV
jgi:hypothetical protein